MPARLTVTVPAPVPGNATVTLTDTLEDIATAGTVTFSNAQFNLGSTSGTVTATVDGGTDGGTITNCAHLTSSSSSVVSGGFTFPVVNGLDLTACSTVDVGGSTCTPGAPGCGWEAGDMLTYSQGEWGGDPAVSAAAALVDTQWDAVFAITGGVLEVGIPGTAGFSLILTDGPAALDYLPASGAPGPLTSDLINPTSSASGSFGGNVVGLALNISFSRAGLLGGVVAFGGLNLCGVPGLPNMSVADFLGVANVMLGGGSAFNTDLALLTTTINVSFADGPSTFAQDHVVNGACP